MDKILISVYVLSIGEEYDLFIPINEKVSDVIHVIQKSIYELSGGYYKIKDTAYLCDGIEAKIINKNNIVKFSGIRNGARLLLV